MTIMERFRRGRGPAELYETYLVPGIFAPWAERLIEIADPASDGRYLDVACGTGVVSRTLARRLGADARIDAVDAAEPMLAAARAELAKIDRKPTVCLHAASADALPFADAVFDGAFCQQGVQFFPDKQKSMTEIRRALKDGAFFAASVWRVAGDGNKIFDIFQDVIAARLGDELLPLGPFQFGDMDALGALVESAGFKIRSLRSMALETSAPPVEEFAPLELFFLGKPGADGSLQPVVDPADPDGDAILEGMIADLREALRWAIAPDGRIVAEMTANVLIAEA